MYKSFQIQNFRCFDDLSLQKLARVNLVAGLNNVGKTALLEAIFLHVAAYNPAATLQLSALRGIEGVKIEFGAWTESPWDSIFRNFDTSNPIRLVGDNESTGRRTLTLRVLTQAQEMASLRQYLPGKDEKSLSPLQAPAKVLELEYEQLGMHGKNQLILDQKGVRIEPIPPSAPFPGFFVSDRAPRPSTEDAELFGKLEVVNKQAELLRVLQLIEPRLKRLAMLVVEGLPLLHGDIGEERLMALPLMGGGMARSMGLVLRLCNASNGVLLVDEIENGLHHSVMVEVWSAIRELARNFNAQLIATTHSRECIEAAHEAFLRSKEGEFQLHRLERTRDRIHVVTYEQEELGAAIETGLETR
jgi:hypothetical protein